MNRIFKLFYDYFSFYLISLATVHQIVSRGGRCLIPVFALGRAQELMLILGMNLLNSFSSVVICFVFDALVG